MTYSSVGYTAPYSNLLVLTAIPVYNIADLGKEPHIVTIPLGTEFLLQERGSFDSFGFGVDFNPSITNITFHDNRQAREMTRNIRIKTIAPASWSPEEDNRVPIAHRDCWKVSNTLNFSRPLALSIYEFAISTYPIYDTNILKDDDYRRKLSRPCTPVKYSIETELGRLLNSLNSLPIEIQRIVYSYTTFQCPLFSSLLTAGIEASSHFPRLRDAQNRYTITTWNPTYRKTMLVSDSVVNTLYAESVYIFGESYISDLRFNDSRGISVRNAGIRGIKFSIGPYGLKAFRVVYTDDRASQWLGSPLGGWFGMMYGSDISRLYVTKDVWSPV